MKQPSQRVEDILSKMTLEEKAQQLCCIVPSMVLNKGVFSSEKAEKQMPKGVGRMTQFASGFADGPRQAAIGYNEIQKYVIEKTGVPTIIQNESSSGLVAAEATIFPVPVALASSWEPEEAYKMGEIISKEGKAIGAHLAMSPVGDVCRDQRWGRVDETFGEDPLLASRFTSEEVRGIQGDDYSKNMAALAKHWVAYGASEVGINCATINIGPKEIFEVYATPFAAAIKEHDMQSVMVTYSEIDGRPMSVNDYYTKKVLRDDLGFNGIAICDGGSIPRVIKTQGMYEDHAELAGKALKAGIDGDTPMTETYHHIVEGVKNGKVDEKDLDEALLRTLQFREEMGLLDNPFVDPDKVDEIYNDKSSDEASYKMAEKSIILLKNDGVLPIKKDVKKIAVVGPFAELIYGYFGGYAYPCMMSSFLKMVLDLDERKDKGEDVAFMEGFADMIRQMFDVETMKAKMVKDPSKSFDENLGNYLKETLGTVSLPEALKEELPDVEIECYLGTWNIDNWKETILEAKEGAKDADLIVLALGEITAMGNKDGTSGEGVNNPDLRLPHHQEDLVRAMYELNIPMVMTLFNGRAFALGEMEPLVNAIVDAWYPGPAGAKPLAQVLTGKVNPSGHLPLTFPKISSQCPLYYGTKTGSGYMNINQKPEGGVMGPLYPFGHGLSYTSFELSNLKNDESVEVGGKFKVCVDIENTGDVKGEDVVQIYTHSLHPTINRPIKELRGFKKVELNPHEKKTVEFTFDTRNFGYYNADNEFVIEPRPQEIYACYDSSTIACKSKIDFTGDVKEILHDRVFNFEVNVK